MNVVEIMDTVNALEKEEQLFSKTIQINFLRNFTVEGIKPYLQYYLYKEKIRPTFFWGGYDTIQQEMMDEQSKISRGNNDITVLSLMLEQLEPDYNLPSWSTERVKVRLQDLFALISANSHSLVVLNTFVLPFYSETGINSQVNDQNLITKIADLNLFIKKYAQEHSAQFLIADWEMILRQVGEQDSMDYRNQYLFQAPFKPKFLNRYALEISKAIRALLGQAKKCLVLDCDNTLWGGVVGEEGLHGIKLDCNEYPGKAYYDFQKTVLQLVARGILVTLCSKNNEADVWEVLDKHPYCLLKRSHLAAWRVNWENKVQNLEELAKELNLGINSFVFIDDNPMECDVVAKLIPDITVLQVPKKLYIYPRILWETGLFDSISVSEEDGKRTGMYQQELVRKQYQHQYNNVNEYLASLDIKAYIHRAMPSQIPRIAQLTQKTNQFNLTTRRYSEIEIDTLMQAKEQYFVCTLQVTDKFGDLGLTGIFIAKRDKEKIFIDTFLLSCRILGRQLEKAFLWQCIGMVEQEWKSSQWWAEYVPTVKNEQVADFWLQVGFVENPSVVTTGAKIYELQTSQKNANKTPFIKIMEEKKDGI